MARRESSPAAKPTKKKKPSDQPSALKGWKAIGDYLGVGSAAAQRWAKDGMPVRREGRFAVADADEVRRWLGRESHMPAPAHIATSATDMAAALKESLATIRKKKRS